MQGNLKEIDVTSIIDLIELGQRTGELLIQSLTGKAWFIFFVNGEIVYATSPEGSTNRLRDYLHAIALGMAQVTTKTSGNILEYGQICALLETNVLSPIQATKIINSMITEVLFDLLSLHEGTFAFDNAIALSPQLSNVKFQLIVQDILKQVQTWKQLYLRIQSLDQCPKILQAGLELECDLGNLGKPINLSQWIDGNTSIRQLVRYSHNSGHSIIQIALAIHAAITAGQLIVADLANNAIATKPTGTKLRITCIDDSITICKAVEYILHNNGYQVTSISNPVRALSLVFQLKPNLILCDITMPELDGYELCAMFRKSIAFSQIPIIMLTGKDGFIDRIKARMVGATEYLTKPFGEKELLTIVEKYLGNHANLEKSIPHR
jgi:twitching motility two-component system response regulator PilG